MVRNGPVSVKIPLPSSVHASYNPFMLGAIRDPIAAGTFYPADPSTLRGQLDQFFGKRSAAVSSVPVGPCGLIAPHAGIMYSGQVAAQGYADVAQRCQPDLVLILGAGHTGLAPELALAPHTHWRTPLGESPVDQRSIVELTALGLEVSDLPFRREHSLELQLPFIQYVFGHDVPIVPLCVHWQHAAPLRAAGNTLAEWIADRSVLIVASSDFTHYEPVDRAAARDRAALDSIESLDTEAFLASVQANGWTICGGGAISILMTIASRCGLNRVRRVAYATSGDITQDRSSVVGYAAITFSEDAQ